MHLENQDRVAPLHHKPGQSTYGTARQSAALCQLKTS